MSSPPGRTMVNALALSMVAVTAGMVHSMVEPVVLRPPAPTQDGGPSGDPADLASPDSGSPDAGSPPAAAAPAWYDDATVPAEATPGAWPREITVGQARSMLGSFIFLDARTAEEYSGGFIPGAFHLDVDAVLNRGGLAEISGLMATDEHFVIYCSGPECDAAENLAALIHPAGFVNYRIMTAGWEGWVKAGFPIEPASGPAPAPAEAGL